MNIQITPDIEAILKLNRTRKTAAASGYRPQINIVDDKLACTVITFCDKKLVNPGESAKVNVNFLCPNSYKESIWIGKKMKIQEGNIVVGEMIVEKIFNKELELKKKEANLERD